MFANKQTNTQTMNTWWNVQIWWSFLFCFVPLLSEIKLNQYTQWFAYTNNPLIKFTHTIKIDSDDKKTSSAQIGWHKNKHFLRFHSTKWWNDLNFISFELTYWYSFKIIDVFDLICADFKRTFENEIIMC